jgi:hypothetical protein
MNIEFDKSFYKSLDKINDKTILKKLPKIFEAIEQAEKIKDISNQSCPKRLQSEKNLLFLLAFSEKNGLI